MKPSPSSRVHQLARSSAAALLTLVCACRPAQVSTSPEAAPATNEASAQPSNASKTTTKAVAKTPATYAELVALFEDWRAFERPPLRDGAPDYTAERFAAAVADYEALRARLDAMAIDEWPIPQQVDWHLVRAEMNGWDFNRRVLQPWVRDPAFYQSIWMQRSDVPAHEGPTHHAVVEFWTYTLPLTPEAQAKLVRELSVIPPLMDQARKNLTGNARDLWVAGIRDIKAQAKHLDTIEAQTKSNATAELTTAIAQARAATIELVAWLEAEAPSKTGPSGLGREDYTWYQQQVHYLPMTWNQEIDLLERELDRAWASLQLEEHRNRALPELAAPANAKAYAKRQDRDAKSLMRFLIDGEVLPDKPYFEPALREHFLPFVPEADRNFFLIAAHFDPRPLFSHFFHWFELAQMDNEPHASPIRRGPLLYNIFDTRNEGTATAVEEMFMHAGLYDDSPRAREIVWIMLAQRAARGLGSLHAHANTMTMAEAGTVHVDWTPRGWMANEPELLAFEQHLYLRQPGYGTSYVTGKYLLERLLAHRTQQMAALGQPYTLRDFYAELMGAGCIPIALVHWELTGDDRQVRAIMAAQ